MFIAAALAPPRRVVIVFDTSGPTDEYSRRLGALAALHVALDALCAADVFVILGAAQRTSTLACDNFQIASPEAKRKAFRAAESSSPFGLLDAASALDVAFRLLSTPSELTDCVIFISGGIHGDASRTLSNLQSTRAAPAKILYALVGSTPPSGGSGAASRMGADVMVNLTEHFRAQELLTPALLALTGLSTSSSLIRIAPSPITSTPSLTFAAPLLCQQSARPPPLFVSTPLPYGGAIALEASVPALVDGAFSNLNLLMSNASLRFEIMAVDRRGRVLRSSVASETGGVLSRGDEFSSLFASLRNESFVARPFASQTATPSVFSQFYSLIYFRPALGASAS